jgi:hypothetical protein
MLHFHKTNENWPFPLIMLFKYLAGIERIRRHTRFIVGILTGLN